MAIVIIFFIFDVFITAIIKQEHENKMKVLFPEAYKSFLNKLFPNGVIPSLKQMCKAIEKHFVLLDWHNFGHYYDQTLMEWLRKFKLAWPALKDQYDENFYRMWEYYLNVSAASFRSGKNQLWQIVLTKQGANVNYKSVR